MKIQLIYLAENPPFPNNHLPVLYYENVLSETLFTESFRADDILNHFEKHNYSNGWVNGIFTRHHYHSNSHEVLACFSGEATVQLGGPNGNVIKFRKGDTILLPAGVSHKLLKQSDDFKIVGAYPDGMVHDLIYGDKENYEKMLANVQDVPLPLIDPILGSADFMAKHWTK